MARAIIWVLFIAAFGVEEIKDLAEPNQLENQTQEVGVQLNFVNDVQEVAVQENNVNDDQIYPQFMQNFMQKLKVLLFLVFYFYLALVLDSIFEPVLDGIFETKNLGTLLVQLIEDYTSMNYNMFFYTLMFLQVINLMNPVFLMLLQMVEKSSRNFLAFHGAIFHRVFHPGNMMLVFHPNVFHPGNMMPDFGNSCLAFGNLCFEGYIAGAEAIENGLNAIKHGLKNFLKTLTNICTQYHTVTSFVHGMYHYHMPAPHRNILIASISGLYFVLHVADTSGFAALVATKLNRPLITAKARNFWKATKTYVAVFHVAHLVYLGHFHVSDYLKLKALGSGESI